MQSIGSNQLDAFISSDVVAAKSYKKDGTAIGLGKRTTRISFNDPSKDEKTRVAVASSWNICLGNLLKPITKTNPFVVKLMLVDGQSVDVNIRSLAKRLHISKAELTAKIHEDEKSGGKHEVEKFISSHLRKNENLLGVLDHHKEYMQKLTGITLNSTLKNIMEIYKKTIGTEGEQSGVTKSAFGPAIVWSKGEGKNEKVYIVFKKEFFDQKTKIGEGSFGRVHSSGDRDVLKVAINSVSGAESSLLNEAVILKKLHKTCQEECISLVGVMKPPKAVFQISSNNKPGSSDKPVCGYLAARYENDGKTVKLSTSKEVAVPILRKGFAELFSGLSIMHSQGIYHGDIKLENMAVDEGGKDWKHADFGTAMDLSKIKDEQSMKDFYAKVGVGPFTLAYCSIGNIRSLSEAGQSGDAKKFKNLMEKRDNLATALAFVEKVAGYETMNSMFITENDSESGLRIISEWRLMWKPDFKKLMVNKGYSEEVAGSLYNLISNSLGTKPNFANLNPAELRAKLITALEAKS